MTDMPEKKKHKIRFQKRGKLLQTPFFLIVTRAARRSVATNNWNTDTVGSSVSVGIVSSFTVTRELWLSLIRSQKEMSIRIMVFNGDSTLYSLNKILAVMLFFF